ncbi:MAG: SpoIVB peptidase [Erysipelotrichaceae bacterium]|nr:SpoIVB peptidase [Erysipelotrichaceae bacterium]
MLLKKLSISLIIVVCSICSIVDVYAIEVILGGQSIGIQLNYNGVMISGTYDIMVDNISYNPSQDGYQAGDLITHINNIKVESLTDLSNEIEKLIENHQEIELTIQSNNKTINRKLKYQQNNEQYSTGLYVTDSLTGVGTMTYYNPVTKHFAALGHMMYDVTLSSDVIIKTGSIYSSYVQNIIPSKNGNPGEKIAEIDDIKIGTIKENNNYGIYGTYTLSINDYQTISTASMDEIELGDAYFLTVLEGDTIVKCSIEITNLKKQSSPSIKGICFKITDEKVLNKTNGIVQGMSGSPIIQNGKLIGCVTHVDVNNVECGYGLFIEWMLNNDN